MEMIEQLDGEMSRADFRPLLFDHSSNVSPVTLPAIASLEGAINDTYIDMTNN